MANTLQPQDVYQIMNEIVSQATGRTDLKAYDTSSFVSIGETMLRTGTENIMNAISTVLGRTIFSIRPYTRKLGGLEVGEQRWGAQTRKITFLYSEAEQSQDYNTDLAPTQLADGNSIDMYKIKAPKALQLNFYGTKVLQKHITRFRDQLSLAFQNESEFMRFLDGVMVEFNNEVELLNEGKTRSVLLNFMAGLYEMNSGNVVDLVATFNQEFGTQYTRQQLISEHLEEFMKHYAAQIKNYSNFLTDMTTMYHANLEGHEAIMRHTPKAYQKMFLYEPLFTTAKTTVYPTLFNPNYLDIGQFSGVNYWQSPKNPTEVNVTPNILDTATGESKAGTAQSIPYVAGILFDEEALGVMPQFDYASTTPFNSAGGYYNMFLHWRFNLYNDYTENAILFVLGDGGAPAETNLKARSK